MDQALNSFNKILLVSSEFPPGPGGIGNHAYSLSKELARNSIHTFVVCDADYVRWEDVEAFDSKLPANLTIKRVIRAGFKTYIRRIRYSFQIIKREKINRVIVSGRFSLWCGAIMKVIKPSIKLVAILHGSEVNAGRFFIREFTNWAIGKADVRVPVSEFTFSLLPDTIKQKPYRIIPNGIDCSEFCALDLNSKKISLAGNPSLLTVGNVTPRKGQHRVINALPNLIKRFPEVHYHIVGLPTTQDKLTDLADQLGVSGHITFHGRLKSRDDLADMYKSADCFVILSENQEDGDVEGFGIVILEANYFGMPAIGALGCGIEAAIRQEFNGMLVDGDDGDQITIALADIMNSHSNFSRDAKSWANQHDWYVVVKTYLDILS
jgi:phosphatidyl-myo-inositol dimannoside synthase